MRRSFLIPILALFAIVVAACDWPNIVPPGNAPVRYRDTVFSSVNVAKNVTYGSAVNLEGQTVPLQLDMYRPNGDTDHRRAAIVWIHGGSFAFGDKTEGDLVDEATTFSEEGYVNVSINYRLESPGCAGNLSNCLSAIEEAFQDAQTAVIYLRAHATMYGIDPNLIAIGGTSAGAITALNVGFSSSEDPAARVRAALSLSGAYAPVQGVGAISKGDAPALDFHCTTDPLVPFSQAVSTINTAKSVGLDAFLETFNATCHVPYAQHRQQILDQTRNFLWWEMGLANAEPLHVKGS